MPKPVVLKPMRTSSCSNWSTAPFKTLPRSRGLLTIVCVACSNAPSRAKSIGVKSRLSACWEWMKSLKGHSDLVTLVSAHDEQGRPIVLAVLKGREKKTLVDFLKTIPRRVKTKIKKMWTDLYDGFIHAVEEGLPQAPIVADRFQVTQLYRAAVDPLRKIEM